MLQVIDWKRCLAVQQQILSRPAAFSFEKFANTFNHEG